MAKSLHECMESIQGTHNIRNGVIYWFGEKQEGQRYEVGETVDF
jgi:hypothetical protein